MSDLNQVSVVGTITKDRTLRQSNSGKYVASFSIANNQWNGLQKKDEASFFNVVLFNAESREKFLMRGQQVGIGGVLKQRMWQDKDGNKRQSVEIICHSLQLLRRPKDSAQSNQAQARNEPEPEAPMPEDGMAPFDDDPPVM